MNQNAIKPLKKSSCGCCAVPRRRFLSHCAACAAGATGLASLGPAAGASQQGDKPRIRLVFCHPTADTITWPNIGYDYDGQKARVKQALGEQCPQVEFLPVWIQNGEEAKQVIEGDAEVDGYLVYFVGCRGGGPEMISLLGKAGRPAVLADHLFAGTGNFLRANGQAREEGWPMVGVSTSRLEELADVARCFTVLKKPGATPADFFAAADAVRRKSIAPAGDLSCAADAVRVADVGDCLKRLRESKILVVGRNPKGLITAIDKVFGTPVVPIDFPTLDGMYFKADRDEAAEWADRWIGQAEKVIEPTRKEIVDSGAMYLAMKELMKQHGADAIAINCLGGFYGGHLHAYPCLGFCEFNNGGQVGACEADLMSTITMVALRHLARRPGFISDPVFDTSKHQIIYAHCVAPWKVFGPEGPSNPFHIRDHSEDRQGAAVRSLLPLGHMTTTLKFSPQAKLAVLHQGKTVANLDVDRACRTKLAVDVRGDVDQLLNGWRHGWHRVTFYGDLKEPVAELCKALGVELIQEA